jgi:DNA replication licensing factor MCM4
VGGEDDEEEGLTSADRAAMEEDGQPHVPASANAEMEQKLIELSTRHDIYDLLARSMAPSIWEMEDVKKGILLQLFGGTNKNIARGGGGGGPRYRGDINILMVGDPGTSKSQILQVSSKGLRYRSRIDHIARSVRPQNRTPRSVYLWKGIFCCWSHGLHHAWSGLEAACAGEVCILNVGSDSAAVLIFSVYSGALVLSDGGVCCIDEFDKMSDATRSVLHEVMVIKGQMRYKSRELIRQLYLAGTTNRLDSESWNHHDSERQDIHPCSCQSCQLQV